jgi:hypothetical protein
MQLIRQQEVAATHCSMRVARCSNLVNSKRCHAADETSLANNTVILAVQAAVAEE